MTIRVLSFDFDGCLFNLDYIYSEKKDVIESNKAFFAKIKEENAAFGHVYTFVGSNRQSNNIDITNSAYGKGSCFPAVKKVSDHLGTTLDTLLLADIYGDLPDGTSYKRAIDKENKEEHKEWLFDDTKATILYAQMHKIANESPKEQIVFDFYDDRKDIHGNLSGFYKKYPELIPSNVTLRLHQYAGDAVTLMAEIEGKKDGIIDSNYRQTVKDMAAQAVNGYNNGINDKIFVTEYADANLLTNRKPLSISAPVKEVLPTHTLLSTVSSETNEKLDPVEEELTAHPLLSTVSSETNEKLDPVEEELTAHPSLSTVSSEAQEKLKPVEKVLPTPPVLITVDSEIQEKLKPVEKVLSTQPVLITVGSEAQEKLKPVEKVLSTQPVLITVGSETQEKLKPVEKVLSTQPVLTKVDHEAEEILVEVDSDETLIAKEKFRVALEAIATKAIELQETANALRDSKLGEDKQNASYNSYKKAAVAANILHTSLKGASESYFKDGNKEAFKRIADNAIDTARKSELKNHRGWKEVLGYTALAVLALLSVATAGIAYAIAGGINYAVNRQFFFSTTINTDSINKVDDLDKAIEEIAPAL